MVLKNLSVLLAIVFGVESVAINRELIALQGRPYCIASELFLKPRLLSSEEFDDSVREFNVYGPPQHTHPWIQPINSDLQDDGYAVKPKPVDFFYVQQVGPQYDVPKLQDRVNVERSVLTEEAKYICSPELNEEPKRCSNDVRRKEVLRQNPFCGCDDAPVISPDAENVERSELTEETRFIFDEELPEKEYMPSNKASEISVIKMNPEIITVNNTPKQFKNKPEYDTKIRRNPKFKAAAVKQEEFNEGLNVNVKDESIPEKKVNEKKIAKEKKVKNSRKELKPTKPKQENVEEIKQGENNFKPTQTTEEKTTQTLKHKSSTNQKPEGQNNSITEKVKVQKISPNTSDDLETQSQINIEDQTDSKTIKQEEQKLTAESDTTFTNNQPEVVNEEKISSNQNNPTSELETNTDILNEDQVPTKEEEISIPAEPNVFENEEVSNDEPINQDDAQEVIEDHIGHDEGGEGPESPIKISNRNNLDGEDFEDVPKNGGASLRIGGGLF